MQTCKTWKSFWKILEINKGPQRIIESLSLIAGEKILPGETLVIFDEIQECPAALNAFGIDQGDRGVV